MRKSLTQLTDELDMNDVNSVYWAIKHQIKSPDKSVICSMLGKNLVEDILKHFSFFSQENRLWHFMQIVSRGDNLHEILKPVFWRKNKMI